MLVDSELPDARFKQIHIDIIKLLNYKGFIYCLTMTDRYSRWPEATTMADMEATIVAKALVHTWISRFGTPEIITTDQGGQFDAELFKALTKLLGSHRISTSAYHPKSNELIDGGTEF